MLILKKIWPFTGFDAVAKLAGFPNGFPGAPGGFPPGMGGAGYAGAGYPGGVGTSAGAGYPSGVGASAGVSYPGGTNGVSTYGGDAGHGLAA